MVPAQNSKKINGSTVEFRIINGKVIEKGGVAFSNVTRGKFSKEFAKKIPGAKKTPILVFGSFSCFASKKSKSTINAFNTRDLFVQKKTGLVVVWI